MALMKTRKESIPIKVQNILGSITIVDFLPCS